MVLSSVVFSAICYNILPINDNSQNLEGDYVGVHLNIYDIHILVQNGRSWVPECLFTFHFVAAPYIYTYRNDDDFMEKFGAVWKPEKSCTICSFFNIISYKSARVLISQHFIPFTLFSHKGQFYKNTESQNRQKLA